jgi:hypothetical protein
MDRMCSTGPAEFLKLQPFGGLFLVLGGGVIPIFAFITLQGDDVSHDGSNSKK